MLLVPLCFAACAPPGASDPDMVHLLLPEGNAEAGRKALADLRCVACHTVRGEDALAELSKGQPGPMLGGSEMAGLSRGALATALIAPAHVNAEVVELWTDWSDRQRVWLGPGHQFDGGALDAEMERSRMRDYRSVMTVQQLCDLVAFLQQVSAAPK